MLFPMHFFAAKNSMSFALRVFHFSAWGTGKYVRSLVQPLLKSRGSKSKSNLKNFLESVYSNLKKSYKLLLDTSFLLKTFQGISRETCCGKIFLDFNFLNSMCNEIEGNIDLRTCSSILGILEKPVIPRSN